MRFPQRLCSPSDSMCLMGPSSFPEVSCLPVPHFSKWFHVSAFLCSPCLSGPGVLAEGPLPTGSGSQPLQTATLPRALMPLHPAKAPSLAVTSHTPPRVLIRGRSPSPPQPRGRGCTGTPPPSPRGNAPDPQRFSFSPLPLGAPPPGAPFLLPSFLYLRGRAWPKMTKNRRRDTSHSPSQRQRHSPGPRARPHPSQPATATPAPARPGRPPRVAIAH